jgi:hypothetical protein
MSEIEYPGSSRGSIGNIIWVFGWSHCDKPRKTAVSIAGPRKEILTLAILNKEQDL